MDRFEEIRIGERAEITHHVTEDDLQQFASLTGDYNPLHMNDSYAAKTTFKKRVVHGMLTASFISTIIGTKLPGEGALWFSQNLNFLLPARIGDTIKVEAVVKHKSLSNRIIVMEINIFNQLGQKLIDGETKVKLLEEEEERVMDSDIRGAAIVTGASRGIGAAVASSLASDGYGVVINYQSSQEEAENVLKQVMDRGERGITYKADVRDYQKVAEMAHFALDKFGKIDVIVNNATGKVLSKDFSELSWDEIQVDLDVHLRGSFNTCKAVIPHMVEQKKGKVINIGSIYSDNVPPLKLYGYTIAKASLAAFTKSLALEYGTKGLNINCIAPGMTDTMLIADLPEKAKMLAKTQNPLRRLAKPLDIANVVSFLASDSGDYISGETIRVCGGQVMV